MSRVRSVLWLRRRMGALARSPSVRPWRLVQAACGLCMEPSFLIAGAQRSGTTSLFRYLVSHPRVRAPLNKEIHYFDLNYAEGLGWYLAHFPAKGRRHEGAITGEASPYYMFHPLVPGRIRASFPAMRLVFLLRDPVERAYSHYRHSVRLGFEPLSFAEALAAEPQRLHGAGEGLEGGGVSGSAAQQHFSYASRGLYVEQLRRYAACFTREQMLIVTSEALFAEPAAAFARILEFLELEAWAPPSFPVFNRGGEREPDGSGVRERLREYFGPWNRSLGSEFGVDVDAWS